MRFDDTLETVLAADLSTPFGMQSAWRQLVDLIGRRRAPPDTRALATLRRIRAQVPPAVRAASARGLEHANPPAPLVRIFALDELAIALPVLRSARLASADWVQLLPDLSPPARAVLRNRRDLSPVVRRALDSFGPIDFVLPDESPRDAPATAVPDAVAAAPIAEAPPVAEVTVEVAVAAATPAVAPEPPAAAPIVPARPLPPERLVDWTHVLARPAPAPAEEIAEARARAALPLVEAPHAEAVPAMVEAPAPAVEEDLSFVALAGFAAALPNPPFWGAAEPAAVQSGTVEAVAPAQPIAPVPEAAQESAMATPDPLLDEPATALESLAESSDPALGDEDGGTFEIAEVVARIDAFWRNREEAEAAPPRPPVPAEHFRFETDAKGVIRWVEGASRAPIVGLSLDVQGPAEGASRVDGIASGAFRRRAGFSNARLEVDGESDASGAWLISAIPVFDPANGRFTGYRGTARRPRADERAEPVRTAPASPADSLRQLVHELRTPTNAIAGFAEMIETQMLGPVADPYRDRAGVIRAQAKELLGAIDDLDLAARIDSAALSLVPGRVQLRPVLAGIADDLAQLTSLRGSWIALPIDDLAVTGDRRAVERLLARLMATLVSASGPCERIGVRTTIETDEVVTITIDRPKALSDYPGESVLGIDDEGGDSTLLGTGFALRLARNLARELGGSLVIEPESLTLRLPGAVTQPVGQAHLS